MAEAMLLVKEGDSVVIDVNGERKSLLKLKGIIEFKVGKHFVPVAPLFGAPYGAMFEVTADGKALQRVLVPPPDEVTRITDTDKDNSNLFDRNTENQKLQQEDIEALKKSGKAGAEIVDALCSNSATFQTKTEFAQDKYKRRKAKKYLTYLTVRRPTARALCETYFDKGPERIWNLRFDSLAIILSLANVAAGSQVLVLESCQGLVTAAVAERLGGYGRVCAAYINGYAPLDAVKALNLSDAQLAPVCCSSMHHLRRAQELQAVQPKAKAQRLDTAKAPTPAVNGTPATGTSSTTEEQLATATAGADAGAGAEGGSADGSMEGKPVEDKSDPMACDTEDKRANTSGQQAQAGQPNQQQQVKKHHFTASDDMLAAMIARGGFSSVIIADPKLHPTAALDHVWQLLAPSATFVVYSPWVQPLAEAFSHVQAAKCYAGLQLQESWLRPYQVLPARTHPEMTCTGTGGYILSGIKVLTGDGSKTLGQVLASTASPSAAGGQRPEGGAKRSYDGKQGPRGPPQKQGRR